MLLLNWNHMGTNLNISCKTGCLVPSDFRQSIEFKPNVGAG